MELEELQRQRDLVQKHLAWLDRQIAQHKSSKSVTVTQDPDGAIIGADLEPLGRQATTGISNAQKVGCLALLVLILLVFLGSLFVLPNFLYR